MPKAVSIVTRFSNATAYYGSTIASGEAFTNRFLSFALSGLIEIPGHCLSPWLMNIPFPLNSLWKKLISTLNFNGTYFD
ncbi:hypothetical protein ACTXT7_007069 [Hymenolepis weldensis]